MERVGSCIVKVKAWKEPSLVTTRGDCILLLNQKPAVGSFFSQLGEILLSVKRVQKKKSDFINETATATLYVAG